jgi:Tfp pilus assembly protein PilF
LALALLSRYDDEAFQLDRAAKSRALNNAGYVAMMKGDLERAQGLFQQALDADPAFYAKAYQNLQLLMNINQPGAPTPPGHKG